jgi:hypothetical protein
MQVSKSLPHIQKLVTKLEEAGYTISMTHCKLPTPRPLHGSKGPLISGESGFFIKRSPDPDTLVAYGLARCSIKDQFSRARGTQIAFNRAIHNLSYAVGRTEVKHLFRNQEDT